MTREELEERMFQACNCTIAGTYSIFQGMKAKLADIAEEYAKEKSQEAVKYTLEQAAEKGKAKEQIIDTGLPLPRGGSFHNKEITVDKQSVLSLEEQIIKDLKL